MLSQISKVAAIGATALLLGGCITSTRSVVPTRLPEVTQALSGDIKEVVVERVDAAGRHRTDTFRGPTIASIGVPEGDDVQRLVVFDSAGPASYALPEVREVRVTFDDKAARLVSGLVFLGVGAASLAGGGALYSYGQHQTGFLGGLGESAGGVALMALGGALTIPGIVLTAQGAAAPERPRAFLTSVRVGPTGVSGRF